MCLIFLIFQYLFTSSGDSVKKYCQTYFKKVAFLHNFFTSINVTNRILFFFCRLPRSYQFYFQYFLSGITNVTNNLPIILNNIVISLHYCYHHDRFLPFIFDSIKPLPLFMAATILTNPFNKQNSVEFTSKTDCPFYAGGGG